MKFLLQRVSSASVHIIDTDTTDSIGPWYLVYVWISTQDLEENRKEKIHKFVRRVGTFDLFSGKENKKSRTLEDIQWELLVISNFTLYGRNKKGSSIDFCHAAPYDQAEQVYTYLTQQLQAHTIPTKTWVFWAMMQVSSTNDWPINLVFER